MLEEEEARQAVVAAYLDPTTKSHELREDLFPRMPNFLGTKQDAPAKALVALMLRHHEDCEPVVLAAATKPDRDLLETLPTLEGGGWITPLGNQGRGIEILLNWPEIWEHLEKALTR